MENLKENEDTEQNGKIVQFPVSPVKSKTAAITATVDQQLAEKNKRAEITAGVVAKREAAALEPEVPSLAAATTATPEHDVDEFGEPDLESKAAAVQAANDATPVNEPADDAFDTMEQAAKEIFQTVKMVHSREEQREAKEAEFRENVIAALHDIAAAIDNMKG